MEKDSNILSPVKGFVSLILRKLSPVVWKNLNELRYWESKKKAEGELSNHHYEYFYSTYFGLELSYYTDKIILDIGCGPRGSLEWATMASRRIGLDPLVDKYLRLGARDHKMEYINASSENIPLEDATCDAVFSFNSLDHVDDVDQTMSEIKRIIRPGGIFLLIVEINHTPTDCEPHWLTPRILIDSFSPEFDYENLKVYKPLPGHGVYGSIRFGEVLANPEATCDGGYLSVICRRR